jgi:excisionase family DNA binding protein
MSHPNSIRIEKNSSNSVRLLTRKEAADRLSITLPTLHNWSKSGILQAYYLGRRIYYKEDELMNALQKRWDRKGSLPPSFLDNPA